MAFRTLEISNVAEIHIKDGQLEVSTVEGTSFIPIEDLSQIMVHGANIRLVSTTEEKYLDLWMQIVIRKISNQARALSILGLDDAEEVAAYIKKINEMIQ